jgi:hypothetical protein
LLSGRPGSLEPNPEVRDLLNSLVDPRYQLIPLVLYLLPRVASQIERQFPLFMAKVDLARFAD